MSRDPIGEEGGVNLYAGIGGDPINRIDILGARLNWNIDIGMDEDRSTWPPANRDRAGYVALSRSFTYSHTSCDGGHKLIEINTDASADIHVSRGYREYRYPNPPHRTTLEHEQAHADNLKRNMEAFDFAANTHCGTCLCPECYDATERFIQVLFRYYDAVDAKEASDLDRSDYGGGTPSTAIDLNNATSALSDSRDALNLACGYLP